VTWIEVPGCAQTELHTLRPDDRLDGGRAAAIFGTIFALMQFVCSPLLGFLPDRFGRRAVIILSNLGHGARKLRLMPV
jgi:MFS family permease